MKGENPKYWVQLTKKQLGHIMAYCAYRNLLADTSLNHYHMNERIILSLKKQFRKKPNIT